MPEDKKQPEKPLKSDEATLTGAQGNTGQYGQGQYDSEGNPDPHGPQAKQLAADEPAQNPKKASSAKQTARQSEVPQD
ncbi:hypothetical protein [Dictyobacter arantiisoli]|uniref:Uncharacterized protein n=1 Tax=Dictyobacter arantiisoli TaxID=2014874 RepID=A0A5A5T5X3_9CHLR|nr:hypothetical protein [Dictyobacter arantiisoli]GCF06841.1 hypothetical protein KDI_04050 [Dictyobacter arantiisoli]